MDGEELDGLDLDDATLEALCTRDLSAVPFPIVHLGAFYAKHRVAGLAVYRTVVMATGVTASGELEAIGVTAGDGEDATFWTKFLLSLKVRGLNGVRTVASGDHGGLLPALEAVFPRAYWHPADLLEDLAEDAPALLDLRIERDAEVESTP